MIAFVNASPLIFLSKLGNIHLLDVLYDKIITTKEVIAEVTRENKGIHQEILRNYIKSSLHVDHTFDDEFANNLLEVTNIHRGEATLTALARHYKNEPIILILDDKGARKVAKTLGIKVTGTIGIILRLVHQGHFSKSQGKDYIDSLVKDHGLRMSTSTYIKILQEIEQL